MIICCIESTLSLDYVYHFVWGRIAKYVIDPPLFSQDHCKAQSVSNSKKPEPKLYGLSKHFAFQHIASVRIIFELTLQSTVSSNCCDSLCTDIE